MNPSTRTLTPLTLALVETMATDPQSPPALRAFHAANLADLKRRAAGMTERPASPFSRYEHALKSEILKP